MVFLKSSKTLLRVRAQAAFSGLSELVASTDDVEINGNDDDLPSLKLHTIG